MKATDRPGKLRPRLERIFCNEREISTTEARLDTLQLHHPHPHCRTRPQSSLDLAAATMAALRRSRRLAQVLLRSAVEFGFTI